ncbi:uncharacterized protein LOC106637530 [Copidosoma floridanum]|uniref:uncharacterized protein LOC106637530 n=1 Tax=Copidosoma floridanum TaxID=29053 RepID=UPI0006C95B61|nr:uncharacterized protein LOC106637530 [Copidosoma floridanum]XP_014205831.1 uncharacterized protein LOC106637530 [Copidosoma floridanum]
MKDKNLTTAGQSWRQPDAPLNVWQVVEGQQKLEDGTTRPIKFSIQEVPENRHEEAVDFMMKYFVDDEPMSKYLNFKNDSDAKDSLRITWNYCLQQGIVEAAYVLDSNSGISELAAVNMLYVANDKTEKEMGELRTKYKSENFKKILDEMEKLSKKADVRKVYGVDEYIGAVGLSVSHKYRGQKLGLHMLEARHDIGKKYGIPATSTVFTARSSQVLAERAGYQTKSIQKYLDILDQHGKLFFAGIEAEDMRVMIKKLY